LHDSVEKVIGQKLNLPYEHVYLEVITMSKREVKLVKKIKGLLKQLTYREHYSAFVCFIDNASRQTFF